MLVSFVLESLRPRPAPHTDESPYTSRGASETARSFFLVVGVYPAVVLRTAQRGRGVSSPSLDLNHWAV